MRLLSSLVGIALAGAIVCAGLAAFDYTEFLKQPVNIEAGTDSAQQEFVIKNGWTARRVSKQLVTQGIIDKHWWFYLHARFSEKASQIKSGEYTLEQGLTPPQLLDVFLTGQSRQYFHGIIEGSTFKQVRQRTLLSSTSHKAALTLLQRS